MLWRLWPIFGVPIVNGILVPVIYLLFEVRDTGLLGT